MLYSKWKKIKKGVEWEGIERKKKCFVYIDRHRHPTTPSQLTIHFLNALYTATFLFFYFFSLLLSMDITTFFLSRESSVYMCTTFFFVLCSLYHSSTLENRKRRRNKWARNINIVIVTWSTRESLQINTIRYCGVNSLFFYIYFISTNISVLNVQILLKGIKKKDL